MANAPIERGTVTRSKEQSRSKVADIPDACSEIRNRRFDFYTPRTPRWAKPGSRSGPSVLRISAVGRAAAAQCLSASDAVFLHGLQIRLAPIRGQRRRPGGLVSPDTRWFCRAQSLFSVRYRAGKTVSDLNGEKKRQVVCAASSPCVRVRRERFPIALCSWRVAA